ncbi:MAG TPA: DUF3604 domain-containing protein [bacterium]|nr:DUF3604 domain-containing protein [bacterium]
MKNIHVPKFERPIRIPGRVKITFSRPSFVFAGQKATLKLQFLLSRNIRPHSSVKLQIAGGRNNKGYFSNIQITSKKADGFICAKLKNRNLKISKYSGYPGTFIIHIPDTGIKKEEYLEVVLRNVYCETASILNKFFVLYQDELVSASGPHRAESVWNQENQKKILSACLVHILGRRIHHMKIHAPSNVLPEKNFSVLIRPEDKFHNLSSEIPHKKIYLFCGRKKLNSPIKRVKNSTCLEFETALPEPGIYRLTIKYAGKKFVSNPIICSENEKYNLYWGMIHGHTEMSDGVGTIDHYFHQLKNEARLDFGAPGDHDHTWETTEKMWKKTCETVKKWHKPGKFITFSGYEWAKWRRNGDGDRNVYYFHDDRPMYRSDEGHFPTPKALFKALKKEKAIVIPHHTAHGGNFCDWKDHDETKERLVEIYQMRGSYECSEKMGNPIPECKSNWQPFKIGYLINALLSGWKVGFTGGGDDHIGHAGTDFPQGSCNYKDGLTGVFANQLSREGIWEALWNRRTIATTGARIYLFYTMNGNPLGKEINFQKAGIRKFHIIFHGTDILERIEIIRNNCIVATIKDKKMDVEVHWQDSTPVNRILLPPTQHSKHPFAFYYIRAIQRNQEVAWASPVWIIGK